MPDSQVVLIYPVGAEAWHVSVPGLSYGCGRLAGVEADGDARSVLRSLTGQEILTVTGRPNRILQLDGDDVIVATERSPAGTAVPIQMVQSGLDRLQEAGDSRSALHPSVTAARLSALSCSPCPAPT